MPILHVEYGHDDSAHRVILPVRAQTGSYVRRRRAQRSRFAPPRPVRGFHGELADRFFAARPDAGDAAFVAWCNAGCPPLPGR
jgi:hypothetical protein